MYVIDVYSPKGGVGKTTTSAAIASCLSQQGYNVALVDLDEQRSAMDLFDSDKLGVSILSKMPRKGFDFVVVDHHPSHKRKPTGDLIIMPMRPSTPDIKACKRAARNVAGKNIMLVVSIADLRRDNEKLNWLEMRNNFNAQLIKSRNIYGKANDAGLTVFQMGSKYGASEARKEILTIVEKAKQQIFKEDTANV